MENSDDLGVDEFKYDFNVETAGIEEKETHMAETLFQVEVPFQRLYKEIKAFLIDNDDLNAFEPPKDSAEQPEDDYFECMVGICKKNQKFGNLAMCSDCRKEWAGFFNNRVDKASQLVRDLSYELNMRKAAALTKSSDYFTLRKDYFGKCYAILMHQKAALQEFKSLLPQTDATELIKAVEKNIAAMRVLLVVFKCLFNVTEIRAVYLCLERCFGSKVVNKLFCECKDETMGFQQLQGFDINEAQKHVKIRLQDTPFAIAVDMVSNIASMSAAKVGERIVAIEDSTDVIIALLDALFDMYDLKRVKIDTNDTNDDPYDYCREINKKLDLLTQNLEFQSIVSIFVSADKEKEQKKEVPVAKEAAQSPDTENELNKDI